jgi:hypothetical protein
MSEKADFEAEVKALEEFQKVSPLLSPLLPSTWLTDSNPVSQGLFDLTRPLMSSPRGVLCP